MALLLLMAPTQAGLICRAIYISINVSSKRFFPPIVNWSWKIFFFMNLQDCFLADGNTAWLLLIVVVKATRAFNCRNRFTPRRFVNWRCMSDLAFFPEFTWERKKQKSQISFWCKFNAIKVRDGSTVFWSTKCWDFMINWAERDVEQFVLSSSWLLPQPFAFPIHLY